MMANTLSFTSHTHNNNNNISITHSTHIHSGTPPAAHDTEEDERLKSKIARLKFAMSRAHDAPSREKYAGQLEVAETELKLRGRIVEQRARHAQRGGVGRPARFPVPDAEVGVLVAGVVAYGGGGRGVGGGGLWVVV